MTTPNLFSITSVKPGILASTAAAAGESTIYTVGAGKAAKLATMTLTNTSASPVTVSVSLVRSGSTAGSANRVLANYSLAAGDDVKLEELAGAWMGEGDFVSVNADTADVVAASLTGLEFA